MPNIDIQGKSVSLELAFNLPPRRAVEYLQAKGVVIDFDWENASDEAKARAFTAAGVYRLDIPSDMKELVTQAVEKGTPYNEFKTQMLSALASKGYIAKNEGLAPYRLKNIYRQNIQNAYQAGSYKDLDESKKYLPYWKFIAIDDARTTTACRSLNKTVLPADDPFWNKHFPPNHFGCRSNVMALTKDQALKEGITSADRRNEIMESNPPAKGFDYNPGKAALWDKNGAKYDCIDSVAFTEDSDCLPSTGKKWNEYKRPDIKLLPDSYFINSPQILKRGNSVEEAIDIIHTNLGFDKQKVISIQSPLEAVHILEKDLAYIAKENRDDAREWFVLFIKPALENPFEIYAADYPDGLRLRYISLFKGDYNLFMVTRFNKDGSMFYNLIPSSQIRKLNALRKGLLLWAK